MKKTDLLNQVSLATILALQWETNISGNLVRVLKHELRKQNFITQQFPVPSTS